MNVALTNLLPIGLRPYAKAVFPFVVTIGGVVYTSLHDHNAVDFDTLSTAITGLVATVLAFAAPNKPTV